MAKQQAAPARACDPAQRFEAAKGLMAALVSSGHGVDAPDTAAKAVAGADALIAALAAPPAPLPPVAPLPEED